MAHICPETNDTVLYLDCLDCDTKSCRKGTCYDELSSAHKSEEDSVKEHTNPAEDVVKE